MQEYASFIIVRGFSLSIQPICRTARVDDGDPFHGIPESWFL